MFQRRSPSVLAGAFACRRQHRRKLCAIAVNFTCKPALAAPSQRIRAGRRIAFILVVDLC